jgi:hypothetical protein
VFCDFVIFLSRCMSINPSGVSTMDMADEQDLKKATAGTAGEVSVRDHTWMDGYVWESLTPNYFHDFTNPESLGYVFDSGETMRVDMRPARMPHCVTCMDSRIRIVFTHLVNLQSVSSAHTHPPPLLTPPPSSSHTHTPPLQPCPSFPYGGHNRGGYLPQRCAHQVGQRRCWVRDWRR